MRLFSKKIAAVRASECPDLCGLYLRIPNALVVKYKNFLVDKLYFQNYHTSTWSL